MRNLLITITGNSGVGKDTIAEYMRSKTGWNVIRSYTNRPMREGETGREHRFVTHCQDASDACFAYTKYGGYDYWVHTTQITEAPISIYIVDEKGLADARKHLSWYGDHVLMYTINVLADECVIKERGVTEERIKRDKERVCASVPFYDCYITNNTSKEVLYAKIDKLINNINDLFDL